MKVPFFNLTRAAASVALSVLLYNCSDETITGNIKPLSSTLTASTTTGPLCAECTYVVPANTWLIDGKALNLQPGAVIGLSASVDYKNLLFRNIVGSETNPIIIKNCGGVARVNGTGANYSIRTENSKYFRITGGNSNNSYGIVITGGHMGVMLDKLSTNFEVDHIEIGHSGFAGIMAKTDPSCDDATIRGNFLMDRVSINHNYIHDTAGEGLYIGNSFFDGMSTACGVRLPHEIHHLKVFNNKVKNTGWDGIQVGCATKVSHIYGNTIENYGFANIAGQRNGIQIGAGTGGVVYGNLVKDGKGNGLIMLGLGDNVAHDNVIVNAGEFGIFADERNTPGPGFKFINNTIISPKLDGIRLYSDLVPMNYVLNNIIVNPGNYSRYTYPRKAEDAFIFSLNSNVKVTAANNYFHTSVESVQFVDVATSNYRVLSSSPVIDKGMDITLYNIKSDYYRKARLKGLGYDIGAVEF